MSLWNILFGRFGTPTPAPTVPPVVDTPADPLPASQSGKPVIKLEFRLGSGPWREMRIPIGSAEPLDAKKFTVKKKWAMVRVTVISGELNIKGTGAKGPNNPSMTGHKPGRLPAGSIREWNLYLGPLTGVRKQGISAEQSPYSILTKELGEILALSANVEHS